MSSPFASSSPSGTSSPSSTDNQTIIFEEEGIKDSFFQIQWKNQSILFEAVEFPEELEEVLGLFFFVFVFCIFLSDFSSFSYSFFFFPSHHLLSSFPPRGAITKIQPLFRYTS